MSDFITNGELRIEAERLCDENDELRAELKGMQEENAKLRTLLSDALIVMGFDGRQYLDEYLREQEGTMLIRELKSVGIEVE